ncbi:MAG: OmpA family protein [Spirochaetes bacterium]|nr:OmpA family protein [Spirochaetota bacterium]
MSLVRKSLAPALIMAVFASSAFAFDPPTGGDAVAGLAYAPTVAGGITVTSGDSPWADALNPAASGGQQRTVLDMNYVVLAGFEGQDGFGQGFNLGVTVPKPYGVWTFGAGLLSVPATITSMPLGTVGGGRISISKDLYPDLYAGIGVDARAGVAPAGQVDWGLGASIGILHKLGAVGFARDVAWGLSLSGLGKSYSPDGVAADGGSLSGFPSPFTPALGIRGDLVQAKAFRIGLNADLSFPTFQNALFGIGLDAGIMGLVSLRAGWNLNARELLDDRADSFIPSFGISGVIPLDRKGDESFISKSGWDRSELRPTLGAQPLYDGGWAVAAGVNLPLGVVDRSAPKIKVDFPKSKYDSYYISPNDDGKLDAVGFPLSITDERYLASYTMFVYRKGEESGSPVRTIGNKESRPSSEGFRGLWDRITYVKKGIPVPETLSWNGVGDSGEIQVDGGYTIVIEARDDNDNPARSEPYAVSMDRTPPVAAVDKPANPDDLIFSPDGDGSKDIVLLGQSGSVEDQWAGTVSDVSGKAVRTFSTKSAAPAPVSWDGANDAGETVPDGVYSYRLAAVDRAENGAEAQLGNIIVNTRKPPVGLSIDKAAFSPNGDGVKDLLGIVPDVPARDGIATWKLSVMDASATEVWSVSGTGTDGVADRRDFDGKRSGAILPEGQYQATLKVSYRNGHAPSATTSRFVLDVTAPRAVVSVDREAFDPAGEGERTKVRISQEASAETAWFAEISGEGKVARRYKFIGKPESAVDWDGRDEAGAIAPDGLYVYSLAAEDEAGNSFSAKTREFKLDTEKKAATLSADRRAFSPNGDGVFDSVRISPDVRSSDAPVEWKLRIYPVQDSSASARSLSGKGAYPKPFTWDGRDDKGGRLPDGSYRARLELSFANSAQYAVETGDIALDTVAPKIEVSASTVIFSPNGDGRKDDVTVTQASVPGDSWEGSILDPSGKAVRKYSWKNRAETFSWDGTDATGNKVPDGSYSYAVESTDAAGNFFSARVPRVALDTRQADVFATASALGFSPNGNGRFDQMDFGLIVSLKDGVSSWSLRILDRKGAAWKTWSGSGSGTIPDKVSWDGRGNDGTVVQGVFTAAFAVEYERGDAPEARTAQFVLDIDGPRISLRTMPEYFSPDNDGVDDELVVDLSVEDASAIADWRLDITETSSEDIDGPGKQRAFTGFGGTGMPASRIVWDGRSRKGELVESATDYPIRLAVTDVWGNAASVTTTVTTDVLIIKDGDKYKIKVPSIVFRPMRVDFNDLPAEKMERNMVVLRRIAAILNRFKDYRVAVEGHAVNGAKLEGRSAAAIDQEETSFTMPFSVKRAQAIRAMLIKLGVDGARLTVVGLGSNSPAVPLSDVENRWKNRRVEFILEKNVK